MSALNATSFFVLGVMASSLFLWLLHWNVRLYTRGALPRAALLQLGRMAGLGGVLAIAVNQGAIPPLLVTLGFLVARPIVLRLMIGDVR